VVPPYELPIGLLTSLIGAPILIATLKRGKDVWR
jgi:iron complex transport system permease protein